jgi:hypothetical protein
LGADPVPILKQAKAEYAKAIIIWHVEREGAVELSLVAPQIYAEPRCTYLVCDIVTIDFVQLPVDLVTIWAVESADN